ncbi:hypothetical protein ACFXKG_28630 [Streptomyces sp. NPDC059255]
MRADHSHAAPALPVTDDYLRDQVGLNLAFTDYMWHYNGFLTTADASR